MKAPFKKVSGGATSPKGFLAGSIYCGIKASNKDREDMALIFSECPSVAAATFTTNKIKAAPVRVSMANLRGGDGRAIIANSGNANACTGLSGMVNAKRMTAAVATALALRQRQVLVCSTGRIGVALPVDRIEAVIPALAKGISRSGGAKAARAIMTSDSFAKEIAVEFAAGGGKVRIGGMAKGAGMIDPNMATMLCFITTDAAIDRKALQKALGIAVAQSFNRITVDGDMSTNDTVILLANGAAEQCPKLVPHSADFEVFQQALNHVTRTLARMIVEDGEGVSKFIEVQVQGAANAADARRVAEAVANSTLVKCAWAGNDPNWGRIVDAIGYSKARIREEKINVQYNQIPAVVGGVAAATPVAKLRETVAKPRFTVGIDLQIGTGAYTVYTTDLTERYVALNLSE